MSWRSSSPFVASAKDTISLLTRIKSTSCHGVNSLLVTVNQKKLTPDDAHDVGIRIMFSRLSVFRFLSVC